METFKKEALISSNIPPYVITGYGLYFERYTKFNKNLSAIWAGGFFTYSNSILED